MSVDACNDAAFPNAIETCGLDAFLPNPTPYAIICTQAEKRPTAPALRYVSSVGHPATDLTVTYADLARNVRRAANLFYRLGVRKGDGVAIMMPNVPTAHIALWAAQLAGTACPINPLLRKDHLVALLREARVKVAILAGPNPDADVWTGALTALREADQPIRVLAGDADLGAPGADGCFETLIALESGDHLTFDQSVDPDGVAAFHTGGTTGIPKLALLSARNQAFVAQGGAHMFGLTADDVMLNGFPLFHVAGSFVFGLSVLCAGGCILIPTRLGMRNRAFFGTIWEQIERYGVTLIAAVPTLVSSISTIAVNADIRALRLVLVGGSPLPSDLADAFERNVGRPIRNILGLTECAGIATVEPFDSPRIAGSTGLPLPFTRICAFRSADSTVDLLSPCAPNESGVIALRGPNVGLGYTNGARNLGTFEPNGWLISGDLGHTDADGRVFITGRAKDVIIRGGHNIDPLSIEEALLQHPEVEFAAAVGQPDPYSGELPVAFVSLRPDSLITAAQLLSFVAPLVAEPAAIPKHIDVLEQLPLTPVGKVYKPALRAIAAERAFIDILTAAGIVRYRLRSDDSGINIDLVNKEDEHIVRSALLGMPFGFNVFLVEETWPEVAASPSTLSIDAKAAKRCRHRIS